jgi:hypothetical protein
MKSTITPSLLIEQIQLGATVLPGDTPFAIGVQVGRFTYACNLRGFNRSQKRELERLYRQHQMTFVHPGDFTVLPFFFSGEPHTRCERM